MKAEWNWVGKTESQKTEQLHFRQLTAHLKVKNLRQHGTSHRECGHHRKLFILLFLKLHLYARECRFAQKKSILELELQVAVSHPTWLLRD